MILSFWQTFESNLLNKTARLLLDEFLTYFKPNYITETSRVTIARAVNAALHDPFAATDLSSQPILLK